MKIPLNKQMKIALLEAVKNSELDTLKIDAILKEIHGKNEFLELMKTATAADDQKIQIEIIDRRDQVWNPDGTRIKP